MVAAYYRSPTLVWSLGAEEDRRFWRILFAVLVAFTVVGVVIPYISVSEPEPDEIIKMPKRFAELLAEPERRTPPPPPKIAEPEPKPETKPKPEKKPEPQKPPKKVAEKKPAPKPKPKPKVRAEPVPDKAAARQKAQQSGLLAARDALSDLRDNPEVARLNKKRLTSKGSEAVRKTQRSVLTSDVATGSGGINTAKLSRDTGGQALVGRSTTKVVAPEGTSTGAQGGGSRKARKPARTIEEIQVVFDRNKGAVFALYNRALRRNPALEGKVVLRLTIEPSGNVTACEVVSSTLDSPRLESRLISRVKLFNFGAKDVERVTITYPIDFLPA